MLQDLRGSVTLVWIVDQHFHYDVLGICRDMRDQPSDTHKLLCLKVELHVCSMLLEMI